MTEGDTLIRKSDEKIFKVKYLSHWTSIIAEDGSGECDTIKYLGASTHTDEYVSMLKGHSYWLNKNV